MSTCKVAVVGAGISGLASSWRLLQKRPDIELTLYESRSSYGGAIATRRTDGLVLEGGPDSLITEKPAGLQLCRDLGIGDKIEQTSNDERRAMVVCNGRLQPIPEGFRLLAPTRFWPFITTPVISPLGKLRIALDLVLPRQKPQPDETLSGFVVRRLGREALERLAQPLIGGIYGGDPERLSLQATMPRFAHLEQKYRSIILGLLAGMRANRHSSSTAGGPRYGLFVSLQGGLQTLVDSLVEHLSSSRLWLNETVTSLHPQDGKWLVTSLNRDKTSRQERYDAVILALPCWAAAQLVCFDNRLASLLAKVRYSSSAVVNLVFNREQIRSPLNSFGFVVPRLESRALLACTYASIKYAHRCPNNQVILRCFCGGAGREQDAELPPMLLTELLLDELKKLLAIQGQPQHAWCAQHNRVMPQYEYGHQALVKDINNQVGRYRNLVLAGNGYTGVGIPDCSRVAWETVEQLVPMLGNVK